MKLRDWLGRAHGATHVTFCGRVYSLDEVRNTALGDVEVSEVVREYETKRGEPTMSKRKGGKGGKTRC